VLRTPVRLTAGVRPPGEALARSRHTTINSSKPTDYAVSKNPYAPPSSEVADLSSLNRGPKPRQVSFAVGLLWASLLLSLPSLIFSISGESGNSVALAAIIGLVLVIYALVACLNICISRGRNWARFVSLMFVLLGLGMLVFMPKTPETTAIEQIVSGLTTLLDVVAMYLLFTKPGSLWFKAAPR